MGSWSTSILGNDFAEDLLPEFKAVFHKYDDKTALALLDKYEAKYISEDEKFDYIYALALFLWQKGRLTDEIKIRALEAIKADKLTAYEEAGKDVLAKRKRVLSELSLKLQSPQPERKKIAAFWNSPFCKVGDIITLKLLSSGEYILIQCVAESICFQSKIDETIKDTFPKFTLLQYCSLQKPHSEDVGGVKPAKYLYDYCEYYLDGKRPMAVKKTEERKYFFYCEWKKSFFKQREYEILENFPLITQYEQYGNELDFCNLWQESDELQMRQCILSQLRIQSHYRRLKNEDALNYLSLKDEKMGNLLDEFFDKYHRGLLPGTSFVEYAKSLGYWNDDLE